MSGTIELSRRRFLKSIASSGAVARVALTDPSGSLTSSLLFSKAQTRLQGPTEIGERQAFGNVAITSRDLLLSLAVDAAGITLTQITNKRTGFDHLAKPSSLFEFKTEGSAVCQSNQGVSIGRATVSAHHTELSVSGQAKELLLDFTLRIAVSKEDGTILVGLEVANRGSGKLPLRAVVPCIRGLVTTGRHGALWAALPQEIGTVVPLRKPSEPLQTRLKSTNEAPIRFPYWPGEPIGMRLKPQVGLPTAMNTMELVSIYDPGGGGGLFFVDVEGDLDRDVAPLQFTLANDSISGYWVTELAPGGNAALPAFAIGVHDTGDWHRAVDYYSKMHRPHWHFPEIPAWFRDQGALYGFSGGGAGAIYMAFPGQSLKTRIGSFENLPTLLDEAESLGTNILYLWDYWEGVSEGGRPAYWNKGDYLPRRDLGGESAFREGIRLVHERGGRVITYLEPFIIFYYSRIGQEKGQLWGGRDAQGNLYQHYSQNYSMVAPFRPWQDHLVGVAERLVRDYDVDGIFLDSWAWQMNWPMQNEAERVLYTPKQYSQGVLALTDRVRTAVQALKPEAVVIGETTAGPISRHWHGGLSADFAWLAEQNQDRIIASPVRYGIPEVNFITNGRNLNQLNQVFAAGHSLALADVHLPWARYIKRLVRIRQEYKDALIYGAQSYQPDTGNEEVAAYYYQGLLHELIAIVNTSSRAYAGRLRLDRAVAHSRWRDLLTDEAFLASGELLALDVAAGELRILLRETSAGGK